MYKYKINNITFRSKKDLQEYAKGILHSNEEDSILEGDDLKFMMEYFENIHHEWDQKKGVGIESIRRIKDEIYRKNRYFQIERIDGSITDISYIISKIEKSNIKNDFRQALRWIIEPQIFKFKEDTFKTSGCVICPVSGELLKINYCHVDHFRPTFEEIVKNFIKENNLTDLQAIVSESGDNQLKATLQDENVKKLFYKYHETVANLRCVSPKVNLSQKWK